MYTVYSFEPIYIYILIYIVDYFIQLYRFIKYIMTANIMSLYIYIYIYIYMNCCMHTYIDIDRYMSYIDDTCAWTPNICCMYISCCPKLT